MSFVKKTTAFAIVGLIASSSAALAQGVGGADVPTDAKKQGTMENGPSSTGMSRGEAKSGAMKSGAMKGGAMKQGGAMKKGSDKM